MKKQRKMSKQMQVEGIRNILFTNYQIDKDLIDLEHEVDSFLSYSENLNIILEKFIKPKSNTHIT